MLVLTLLVLSFSASPNMYSVSEDYGDCVKPEVVEGFTKAAEEANIPRWVLFGMAYKATHCHNYNKYYNNYFYGYFFLPTYVMSKEDALNPYTSARYVAYMMVHMWNKFPIENDYVLGFFAHNTGQARVEKCFNNWSGVENRLDWILSNPDVCYWGKIRMHNSHEAFVRRYVWILERYSSFERVGKAIDSLVK